MHLRIVKNRKLWYTVSLILTLGGIAAVASGGLRYGLDFTGGSLMEINYAVERPSNQEILELLASESYTDAKVQPSGEKENIIRLPELTEDEHQTLLKKLHESSVTKNKDNTVTESRFESFGPALGSELRRHAIYAVFLVLGAIVIYLAYAFRKVTHPVAAWKFGVVSIIALAHDVIMLVGFFAILGFVYHTEIDSLFITALLTLLGFSVHDTIVTFDRIRENLFVKQDKTFEEIVDVSIDETVTRSINTSMTTLFALLGVYLFGGASIHDFSLALIFGIIVGTYSSIFIASPLLVTWYNLSRKRVAGK